jgi:hypothetical protein
MYLWTTEAFASLASQFFRVFLVNQSHRKTSSMSEKTAKAPNMTNQQGSKKKVGEEMQGSSSKKLRTATTVLPDCLANLTELHPSDYSLYFGCNN